MDRGGEGGFTWFFHVINNSKAHRSIKLARGGNELDNLTKLSFGFVWQVGRLADLILNHRLTIHLETDRHPDNAGIVAADSVRAFEKCSKPSTIPSAKLLNTPFARFDAHELILSIPMLFVFSSCSYPHLFHLLHLHFQCPQISLRFLLLMLAVVQDDGSESGSVSP